MEIIRKKIKQAVTTKVSEDSIDIIPNTGATYYMKISLSHEAIDLGFMDALIEEEENL